MMGEPYFEILLGMESAIKLKKPTKKRSEVGNKKLEKARIVLERLHNNQAASAPSSAQKEGEQQTPSTSQVMLVRSEYIAVIYWHYGLNSRSDRGYAAIAEGARGG